MQKVVNKVVSIKQSPKLLAITFAVVFGIIGAVYLLISSAATAPTILTPSSGATTLGLVNIEVSTGSRSKSLQGFVYVNGIKMPGKLTYLTSRKYVYKELDGSTGLNMMQFDKGNVQIVAELGGAKGAPITVNNTGTTRIANPYDGLTYARKFTVRGVIDLPTLPTTAKLVVDGAELPGNIVPLPNGWVYQNPDNTYDPTLAPGTHTLQLNIDTNKYKSWPVKVVVSDTLEVKILSPTAGQTGLPTTIDPGFKIDNPQTSIKLLVDGQYLNGSIQYLPTLGGWKYRNQDGTAGVNLANGVHTMQVDNAGAKSAVVNFTVGTTTTITAAPPTTTASINRFSLWLGTGQTGGPKSITDAINDAVNSHAKMARVEATIPYQSKWNFSGYDSLLAVAKAKNVQVMYLFDYTPQELFPTYNGAVVKDLWGSTSPSASIHSFPRNPVLQDKWVTYAMALVDYSEAHYPGVVGAIEWGNEPNGWEFGSQHAQYPVRPADYASLLKKAHTALKAKYPSIVSVAGGTSPSTTNKVGGGTEGLATDSFTSVAPATWTRVINGVTEKHTGWYDLLKAAGVQPGTHFDHIAGHFYDTTIDSNWSQPFDKLWAVWSGPQVWATEQSASSNSAERANTSEATQATWWQTNLDAWKTKGTQAGVFFAFCNYDRNTTDLFGYYGLRKGDGTPKQAFTVYSSRNGQL